jgi:hypothetical protein
MPDPNGDGHGSPVSNVGSIALTQTAGLSSEAGQGHGETGIIIVGGDAATPGAGSFWDQAAAHTGAATSDLHSQDELAPGSAIRTAAFESAAALAHDAGSDATSFHGIALDHGALHVGFTAHDDVASTTHFETPSLGAAEAGHQLFG